MADVIYWGINMDKIFIEELLVRCIVGVNEEERREKQDVLISLKIKTDLRKAGSSDKFEDAVDYRAIKKKIMAMVESSEYFLVEALAEKIAEMLLEDGRIMEVKVRVEKPTALRFAKSVGVEIIRGREN